MTTASTVRSLYIFGAGGHGRQVAWLAGEAYPGIELCFLVDDPRYADRPVDGIPVRDLSTLAIDPGARYVTAVGDARLRRRAVATLEERGLEPIALVHPRAILAPGAIVEAGAVVAAGSVVSNHASVGAHAIVNLGCTLSHDVHVADFATISPGVHIAGHVVVEADAFLGVGANVTNGSAARPIVIGRDSIVGAGAVVLGDVAAGTTVVGVPARPIRSGGIA